MKPFAVVLKDLRLIVRDRSAFAFMLAVPIVVLLVVAETQSDNGTNSILLPVVNEDQGPIANQLLQVFRKYLQVRVVTRPIAQRLVAVENKAPAALILPTGLSKKYLTEKPSTIELLTDPAQWEALQALRVIMLLADRQAATLGDPFNQELLRLRERNITGERVSFSSLEQDLPGFSLMFVLLTMVFGVSIGLREEEVWRTNVRLSIAPIPWWTVLGEAPGTNRHRVRAVADTPCVRTLHVRPEARAFARRTSPRVRRNSFLDGILCGDRRRVRIHPRASHSRRDERGIRAGGSGRPVVAFFEPTGMDANSRARHYDGVVNVRDPGCDASRPESGRCFTRDCISPDIWDRLVRHRTTPF